KEPKIIENPALAQIKLHQEADGWFTLDPRYGSGEGSVSMAELMLQFRKKRRSYFKSGDTWIKIPELVKQYDWDIDESGKYLKVNAIGLLRLKAAIGDFD